MKQVIQSYRTGELQLAEVPVPAPAAGDLLVDNVCSLVSVGTERYMLDLARKSLLGKAMARPDLVRQVVAKVRTEGLGEAWRQAMGRLDEPVPLGYSSAGVLASAGAGVGGFAAGDRVACSGVGAASHAEVVCVPARMAVRIPDGVSFEEASFVTLGAIALHGVRMARPELGERVVVLGLGLLGLLAVQILKSAGCRVLGVDVSADKVGLALELGADQGAVIGQGDVTATARGFSEGVGADAVLIFASAEGNGPIEMAAEMARVRGRIVVPGLVGLDLPRKTFFEKEISFVVSRAWGPGLYDPDYEERGIDYPLPFVRWTAQRNMAGFLDLIAAGKVRLARLITHRFPIESAVSAYEMLLGGKEKFIGVLLTYPGREDRVDTVTLRETQSAAPRSAGTAPREGLVARAPSARPIRLGFVGAGLFARGTLMPALKGIAGFELRGLATASGVSGQNTGRRHGFSYCTTSASKILEDPDIDLVMVLTRHGSHAALVRDALAGGKDVFVEKPLALDEDQLIQIEEAWRLGRGRVMVGFNRRFAPTVIAALRLLEGVHDPLVVNIRVNAGYVPPSSWVHDPAEGGGRIVGEVCHFVDLAQALTRSRPTAVHAASVRAEGSGVVPDDNVVVTLNMANGSLAGITYTAGGDKAFSRERVEIFGGGAVGVIENFRTLTWTRQGRRTGTGRSWSGVDRGYRGELRALLACMRAGSPFPVPFEDYAATTRATFAAVTSLRTGRTVAIPES